MKLLWNGLILVAIAVWCIAPVAVVAAHIQSGEPLLVRRAATPQYPGYKAPEQIRAEAEAEVVVNTNMANNTVHLAHSQVAIEATRTALALDAKKREMEIQGGRAINTALATLPAFLLGGAVLVAALLFTVGIVLANRNHE